MEHFLPDAAQGGIRNAQIRGNLLERCLLNDLWPMFHQMQVAGGGRLGYHFYGALLALEELCRHPFPSPFPYGLHGVV